MHRHSARLRGITHLLADPIDPAPSMTKSQAKDMLGLEPTAKYISLIGLIDQRKGVHDLLAAEYSDLISSRRVVVLDRHLSQTELWAACIASDAITTLYPKHQYSASILIRAASVGVPVLANAIGWMQDVTDRFRGNSLSSIA